MYQGDSIPGFPSMDAFLYLITPKLELMKQPGYALLEKVFSKLEKLAREASRAQFSRFPIIEAEIGEIIIKDLQEKKDKAKEILGALMECEENYLFTNDSDYLANKSPLQDRKKQKGLRSPQSALVAELKGRIDTYFYIVSRNLKDTVPKIIGNFLIKASIRDVRFVLFDNLSKDDSFLNKMSEPSATENERNMLKKQHAVLVKAERKLMADAQ